LTDFCVVTSSGVLLHCSRPVKLPALDWAALSHGGAQPLRWDDGGEPLRASAWSLFIESRFAGDDWIILAIQPERAALQAAHSFRAALLPVALLALLLAVLVSTNQIRRILGPLQQLLAGTFKVGRQDFYPRIEIDTRDEFGQLAVAFNDMADRLGLQFRIFAAFAEIDRSILTTLELARRVRHCNQLHQGNSRRRRRERRLIEPSAPDCLRIFSVSGHDPAEWSALEFACEPGAIAQATPLQWTAAPALPPAYMDFLRACGAQQFALIPIARGPYAFAQSCLGTPRPCRFASRGGADRRLRRSAGDRACCHGT